MSHCMSAAIDNEKFIQTYLTELIYMDSNQIDTLRAALANNGGNSTRFGNSHGTSTSGANKGPEVRNSILQRLQVIAITARCEQTATCGPPTNRPNNPFEKVNATEDVNIFENENTS